MSQNQSYLVRTVMSLLGSLRSQSIRSKMLMLWGFFVVVMIAGGYGVYYRTLGEGAPYQNSTTEAVLASILFVFGIYVLGLVLHGYLFGKNTSAYDSATVSELI